MKYILSTMANSINYRTYKTSGQIPVVVDAIIIHGGARTPSATSGFGDRVDGGSQPLWTAQGVVTKVTDEQYASLMLHTLFKKHLDANRVKILDDNIAGNHSAIIKETRSMECTDKSDQLTPSTVKQSIAVKTNHHMQSDTQFSL